MNILYISRSVFPYGAAYASRVLHFSKLLNELGHSVHVISDYTAEDWVSKDTSVDMGFCTYQAIYGTPTLKRRLQLNRKRCQCVKQYLENTDVEYIITNSFPFDYYKMKKLMDKKNIPYAIELCEWFDSSNYKFGKADFRYKINERAMRKKYTKENRIIAISRLLQNYYQSFNVNCIRIPTILDINEFQYSYEKQNDKLTFMYAGSPGKSKELLKEIFEAIKNLKEKIENLSDIFCFDIYGVNEKQILLNIGEDKILFDDVKDSVQIHGKVKQELMNEIYLKHDFSIFLRPQRKSSAAGFPTKLAESFAAGTPVITNNTGDISLYIQNFQNGIMLENNAGAIEQLINQLLLMDKDEYVLMRKLARTTAVQCFDYRLYMKGLSTLLKV